MTPRKLDILAVTFSYGGNGCFASQHPDVGRYLMNLAVNAVRDERIGRFRVLDLVDTPITLTRNKAVKIAQEQKFDCLVMLDSDMQPDCELGHDPSAKPFFQTSFERLYQHYERGPLFIGAPYCGPPPDCSPYVFHWASGLNLSDQQQPTHGLKMYDRFHTEQMFGVAPCAAIGTGLILTDMRVFDLKDPPYFYYEWPDATQSEKASTEDVTATRDISFHGQLKLGYNPLLCNWDAWAGHWKPLLVRKPRALHIDQVERQYRAAVERNQPSNERIRYIDFEAGDSPAIIAVAEAPSNGELAACR